MAVASREGHMVGRVAHVVIADRARSGDFSPPAILRAVGAHLACVAHLSNRAAARQRLATITAVYGRFFLPAGAELEGAEVKVPGGRLDLLWRRGEHRWSDEIKTHRLADMISDHDLCDQLGRQALGAAQTFDGFIGVRTCIVSAPLESIIWQPDGSRQPAFGANRESVL